MIPEPIIESCGDRLRVVRDDLLEGGTKLRYLLPLFDRHSHIVYASPAQGGAQLALAVAAANAGKQATIVVAKRNQLHPRTREAQSIGAEIVQIPAGRLNVIQARAREIAARQGAYLLPFGADTIESADILERAAMRVREQIGDPDAVWSAAGSGALSRALQCAFPESDIFAVQVGRDLSARALGRAEKIISPLSFDERSDDPCPFPSDPHYDRKAWAACDQWHADHRRQPRVLFWNVLGALARS